MKGLASLTVLVPLAVGLAGCIPSSVIAPEHRSFLIEELEWQPAQAADIDGVFISTELRGPLATALRKLVYDFEPGGAYTGAALFDDAPPHFEVLTGSWAIEDGALVLDGGSPARIEVAYDGSLRLAGEEGSVVLRKEEAR